MVPFLVEARIENVADRYRAGRGEIRPDEIRHVVISDATIDPGAKLLSLPRRIIDRLGLERFVEWRVETADGVVAVHRYRAAWLSIRGRGGTLDVAEGAEDCPARIGSIPLALLSLAIDPEGSGLVDDPWPDVLDRY